MSGNGLEPGVVCVPVNDCGALYRRCTMTDFVLRINNTAKMMRAVKSDAVIHVTIMMKYEFLVPLVPNMPLAAGIQMVLKRKLALL